MRILILILIYSSFSFFLASVSLARKSCGTEDLKNWVICENDSECIVEVIPCGQVRSINKKFQKLSEQSQHCIAVVSGSCMPDAIIPKAEKFRGICKGKACFAKPVH